jgi:hypothetical protein
MIKAGTPGASLASQYHGIQVSNSVYGKTVKLLYGLTQAAPDLIWYNDWKTGSSPSNQLLASLLQGGGKKSSKGSKKGSVKYYSAAVDLLIGHAPILGVFSAWYNNQKLAVVINSASGLISGGSFTFVPANQPSQIVVGFTVGGSPYQVTEPNFVADRRVRDATLGDNFYLGRANPSGLPGPNQYTVTSGGLYTFNAVQSGHSLRITYFTSASGSPSTLVGILAVSIHEDFTAAFNDYGAPGSITQYGTWERPLWNAAFAVPGRIDLGAPHARDPYTWAWDGVTPAVTLPTALNGKAITVYYGTPVILRSDGTLFSATHTPLNVLNLQFEQILGSGSEYTNFIAQQILQNWAAGAGSVRFDLGVSNSMPNLNLECIGAFTQWPNGDCDVVDMIADIVASGPLFLTPSGGNSDLDHATTKTGAGLSQAGGVLPTVVDAPSGTPELEVMVTTTSQGQPQSPGTFFALTQVVGATRVYSFSSFVGPAPVAGQTVSIANFANAANNGLFTITVVTGNSSGGTFTVGSGSQVNETTAAQGYSPDATAFVLTQVVGSTKTYSFSSYTGSVPVGVGQYVTITGFTNTANNGFFPITAFTGTSTGGTFTVGSGSQVNETHAATASTGWQEVTSLPIWYQLLNSTAPVSVVQPYSSSLGFPTANVNFAQVLAWFGATGGNPIWTQHSSRTGSNSASYTLGPFTPTAGETLLLMFRLRDLGFGLFTSPCVYSVTDDQGNLWNLIANVSTVAGGGSNPGAQTMLFMCQGPALVSTTVTCQQTSGPTAGNVSDINYLFGITNFASATVTPIGHGVNCNTYGAVQSSAGSTTSPGNGLLLTGLEQVRAWCRANGISGALTQDAQRSAKDMVDELLTVANAAPVYSGATLNTIPYDEVSNAGGGLVYTASTAAGPVANLADQDFENDDGKTPPVSFLRKRRADCDNVVSIEFLDRSLDYSKNTISEVDQKAVTLYGPRKGGTLSAAELGVNVPSGSKSLSSIRSTTVAQAIASILVKRGAAGVNQFQFTVKQEWLGLEAMDLVTITDSRLGISQLPVRLLSVKETPKRTLKCVADQFVYGLNHPSVLQTTAQTGTIIVSNVDPGLVNTPIIFQPTAAMLGPGAAPELWFLVSGADTNYGGCIANLSLDGGVSYPTVLGTIGPATTGVLTANFADHVDPDTTNTLAIDLTESGGALSTQSQPVADSFGDPCYLAGSDVYHWEVICYTAVTLTSAEHYSLATYIRRGVLGTAHTAHTTAQRFAAIDGALFRVSMPSTWVGLTLYFKFQAYNKLGGQINSLANCTAYTFTPLAAYLPGGFYVNGS